MSDKTAALLAAGNAMAARLRQLQYVSEEANDWDALVIGIHIGSDAELPYALGVIDGQRENFIAHLKEFVGTEDILKSDASYAYGYLEACDKTFEVRDLARASILHYNELLQIARDLAAAITLPGSNVRATDAVARLRALDGKPKKVPPPPPPPPSGTPPPSSPMP